MTEQEAIRRAIFESDNAHKELLTNYDKLDKLTRLIMHIELYVEHENGEDVQKFLEWVLKKLKDVEKGEITKERFVYVWYKNAIAISTKMKKASDRGRQLDAMTYANMITFVNDWIG